MIGVYGQAPSLHLWKQETDEWIMRQRCEVQVLSLQVDVLSQRRDQFEEACQWAQAVIDDRCSVDDIPQPVRATLPELALFLHHSEYDGAAAVVDALYARVLAA